MIFKNNDEIVLGRVVRELRLKGFFGNVRWKWRKVFLRDARISLGRSLNSHIILLGESGSGKSNACKTILQEISAKGANFVVFDAHDEYVGLAESLGADVYDAAYTGANLFEMPGRSDKEKASETSGTLRRILGLGHMQAYLLYKAILYTYQISESRGREPGIRDLMYTISVFERHAKGSELSVLRSLEHRLTPLSLSAHSSSVKAAALMGSRSVFALGRLGNAEAQAVYVEGFLRKIYEAMLAGEKSRSTRFFVVIEEAGKLGEGSMLARLAAEGRKYGIGIVVVAQRAKALDREIRSNAELFAAFYQREPEELNYIANMIASGNELNRFTEVKKALRHLGRGMAVVTRSRGEPQVVRFAQCECAPRSLSLDLINASRSAIRKDELYRLLASRGFAEPEIAERARRLIGNGTLRYHIVPSGEYSGVWYIAMPRNSAEHDVMVSLISRHLGERGIRNKIYNSSFGPDIILFESGGKRAAVEYETGSKKVEETARMLERRRGRYGKVVVVVNDAFYDAYSKLSGATVMKASEAFGLLVKEFLGTTPSSG